MNEEAALAPMHSERLMAGRRLYSPSTLAAYTALANLPVGFILYGLNLRARGRRGIGLTMLVVGGLALALFTLIPSTVTVPISLLLVIGAVGAFNVYQLEKWPFAQAIREGASPARWWPPAVLLLIAFVVDTFLRRMS